MSNYLNPELPQNQWEHILAARQKLLGKAALKDQLTLDDIEVSVEEQT